ACSIRGAATRAPAGFSCAFTVDSPVRHARMPSADLLLNDRTTRNRRCHAAPEGPRELGDSEAEGDAERRTIHREARAVVELIVDVCPDPEHLAPVEGIADTRDALPGEVRLAGADIDVEGREPGVAFTEHESPLDADDAVPVGGIGLSGPL